MTYFDVAYEGIPTWDIGRPQPAIVRLADEGAVSGPVLDLGCGTGENALFLASRGFDVVGVDLAPRALARARDKARERALDATFLEWDGLKVDELGRAFGTAVDVGMFHTLADEERPVYATHLRDALAPGGRCFLLCWSDRNRWGFGPRRISQMEILGTFERGWRVESIEETVYESLLPETILAWLARLVREP
jgi:cyclopropane fatty-acyl-phospholipid synthase-like methyltransferase